MRGPPPLRCILPNIFHSLLAAKINKEGKTTEGETSLHRLSFQKRTFLLFPMVHKVLDKKASHSFPSFYPIKTSDNERKPFLLSLPNFEQITFFHQEPLSLAKRQSHLHSQTLLSLEIHFTLKPPPFLSVYIVDHLTR